MISYFFLNNFSILYYNKMDVIAQKVKSDWAGKTPDKYSEYDLEILGKILCYFNQSEILQIHPDAYRLVKFQNIPLLATIYGS